MKNGRISARKGNKKLLLRCKGGNVGDKITTKRKREEE
jgi:hypothetical protein